MYSIVIQQLHTLNAHHRSVVTVTNNITVLLAIFLVLCFHPCD